MFEHWENDLFGFVANQFDREELVKEIARRARAGETNFTIDSAWDLSDEDIEYIKKRVEDYV